jgi:hypothetical protein
MEYMNEVYDDSSLLVSGDCVYDIAILHKELKKDDFVSNRAYLHGPYFYLYMGDFDSRSENRIGVYSVEDEVDANWVLIEPMTDEEKAEYTYADKISKVDPDQIIDAINNKEVVLVSMPESMRTFLPPLSNEDDILKRAMKQILLTKNIDIDNYKHRFNNDKNALFNFKSVIKRPKVKLSIMLFNRGCDVLNLKYTIVIEEKDPENPIGIMLNEPIVITSEDTFDV